MAIGQYKSAQDNKSQLVPAFHFRVSFLPGGPKIDDCAFQEVSGIEQSLETEVVVEGGENSFVHTLPKPAGKRNLTLKRAITPVDAGLLEWCHEVITGNFSKPIKPKNMNVILMNAEQEPLVSWMVTNAYPIKVETSSLNAISNELAIETIELAYHTAARM